MENTFKSSVFGGFNRDDVIRYIEKTSLESKQQIEALEQESDGLCRENAELRDKLAAAECERDKLAESYSTASSAQDALKKGLTAAQETISELRAQIDVWTPDLVVLSGLMRLLPAELVDAWAPALINTHPAFLPEFPGAHGVRDALAYGVRVTGATFHVVDAGVDTGPIIAQTVVEVLDDDDEESLHERIKVVERGLLIQAVSEWKKEHP